MKRSYFTWIFTFGLAALLVLLGVMQYRWQSQISESQCEKMRKVMNEGASRFAEDFNREIQGAYFNFQIGADDWRSANFRPFIERYEFWSSKTNYPDLIDGFYFLNDAGDKEPLKFDTQARTFEPIEWTPELRDVFKKASNPQTFQPISEESYTLVVPQHDQPPREARVRMRPAGPAPGLTSGLPRPVFTPQTFGFVIVKLNENVIREKLLPDLTTKYFGDQEFVVNIADKNKNQIFNTGEVKNADIETGLFNLSPSDFVFFANRDLADSIGERREAVIVNSRVEGGTTRTEIKGTETGAVQVEIKREDRPKTQIFSTKLNGPDNNWALTVQHQAGSIDAYIANTKYRNLAVGWGILALLGLSVAAVVFSTQRVRAFAQRQVDFVSSVSHEFRTPLAVIYSAGENLADGVANDRVQTSRYGELIKGEGRKLSAMVEQILEFAGANSGKRKYNFSEVPATQMVEQAIADCRQLVAEQNIKLETDINPNLPLIAADIGAISGAIQNLIANSVKYRNGDGWIKVAASNGDRTIKISVEDRGLGISKSDLRQVFEPFFRAKTVVDAQIHGNGLGLSLVKQTAEAHGGCVFAESELGKGSKFTIVLPAE